MIPRISILLMFLLCIGCRQNDAPPASAGLRLSHKIHDFGDIADTQVVSHVIHVINTGTDSLTITDVHSSCGCTATMVDKKLLAGGDTANLKITFDPRGKANGKVEKKVWIATTAGNDTVIVRTNITGVHKAMMTVSNIFDGDCRKCHVDKGVGKFGRELFDASCSMCHSPGHAEHLGLLKAKNHPDTAYYRMIAHGKPGTNMPAYAESHGGPLTEKQLRSLVSLMKESPMPPAKSK